MIMWGNNATSSAAIPKWSADLITAGSGPTAEAANNTSMFQNSSPENFSKNGHNPFQASGIFGASAPQLANTSGESRKIRSAGWQLREAFEGPVISVAVTNVGANFANGEVVLFSNGGAGLQNGYGIVSTNSSGNMTSVAIGPAASFSNSVAGGRFMNANVVVISFVREKHLLTVNITAGGSGYNNTDVIQCGNGFVNGTATITTNATGGIATATPLNLGLWANNVANNVVTFQVQNTSGLPSTGTSATFTANLTQSTSGNVSVTLGGRAGRVQYECIVAMTGMTQANNPILPS